ncbi:hypothetical protein J3F83DRAFT_647916 [Trichoderma novae-zelandiae]
MASRYSRYDADRRSRSPRDRSPFDRASHYSDGDRRRSSAEARTNSAPFPPGRDVFGDQLRREPPRGPKALIDPPAGPRGGGFAGEFRGGRGRGRGGRGWPGRDDSRDRGRDRDIDFRDRYRDERSREREREREREWRDPRDFRLRRSPIGRARSPTRDFRDRERDIPLGLDAERSRRGSRDGGPPSAGSSTSEPLFGVSPFPRGGGFIRGRGRGGRGEWPMERGRGRVPYDDRGDRYPRSRSQEGRWAREREERERGDRYPEADVRRDPRDERDRGERELFRAKMEARAAQESAAQVKDVSPPPVAPSAPAFGSVPNRVPSTGDLHTIPSVASSKPPPTAPRAFGERPVSAGQGSGAAPETPQPPVGPSKVMPHDSPPIPLGPRLQQPKPPRPSSKQWINPSLKKPPPESPKVMRSQSFAQPRPIPLQRGVSQAEPADSRRPRSSDAKSDPYLGVENRMRAHHSEEPGEITASSEIEKPPRKVAAEYERPELMDHDAGTPDRPQHPAELPSASPKLESHTKPQEIKQEIKGSEETRHPAEPAATKRNKKLFKSRAVRFALPPKNVQKQEETPESDDEDMGDYFDMEINKTEAELSRLQKPNMPVEVIRRYMTQSHGSMVQILNEGGELSGTLGDIPASPEPVAEKMELGPAVQDEEPPFARDQPLVSREAEEANHVSEAISGQLVRVSPQAEEEKETEKEQQKEEKEKEDEREPEPSPPREQEDRQPKAEEMDIDDGPTLPPSEPHHEPEPTVETAINDSSLVQDKEAASIPAGGEPLATIDEAARSPRPAETEPKPPSTPSQVADEDDETETEDEAYMEAQAAAAAAAVRRYMATPPLDSLPGGDGEHPLWYQDKEFLTTLESDPHVDDFVAMYLEKVNLNRSNEQRRAQNTYASNYMQYLRFTMSDDPVATKSRDKFSVSAPLEITGTPTPEQKPEGRGTGRRFATERDLERVLQASMREDEERRERELRIQQEKYRSDKEAVIPDMYWDDLEKQRVQYVDRSGYTPPEKLVSAWEVFRPINNFTEEEAQLFEKRYLELPKQWGKIAEVLPNRDFRACIQYYYLRKGELHLKEKLKKQPKRRKKGGRGKQRSSALVSELGNGEPEGEEVPQESGENGERRRPRRAAAPTWGFEQPATDGESTPAATPGRRGASAASKGDQPEKVDGRKGRRKAKDKDKDKEKEKEKDKDKEVKASKPNQTLAAAPGPAAGKGRGRADSRPVAAEFLTAPPLPSDHHRLPMPFEQPLQAGIQAPFAVPQPPLIERPKPVAVAGSITDVMAAPSLRPEPPPPPPSSITTFNLTQQIPERKTLSQASSYWSVSEANDFPQLLRAFGSDWSAIAKHMGSKTTVMVKNYYVRQKDSGKPEWEAIAQEADAKRARGEKRPDPPVPTTGGRGRRFEGTAAGSSRPLAVAPGGADPHGDLAQPKVEPAPPQPLRQQQHLSSYGVPIAQAPVQGPLAQPNQAPLAVPAHAVPQATQQAISPNARSMHQGLPPFGFPERDREPVQPQRVPLPQKTSASQVPELRDPRPLSVAQQLPPAHHPEALAERERNAQLERMNMEKRYREQQHREQQHREQQHREQQHREQQHREQQHREQQHREQQHREQQHREQQHREQQHREQQLMREREIEIERERERDRERERELRQAESMRLKQEAEAPLHRYEPYVSHRQQLSHGGGPREPFSLSRPPPQESSRAVAPQPYPTAMPQPQPQQAQPMRALLSDPVAVQSPPLAPPSSRSGQGPQQRIPPGPPHEPYGAAAQAQHTSPMPPLTPARPPEPRKSNIMALLNDDPPPPKRVAEVTQNHAPGPSSTPPSQGIGRPPPPAAASAQGAPIRREPDAHYSPYGRTPSSGASAMPSLKPPYSSSPAPSQHISGHRSMPSDPAVEVDYYRQQHAYPPSHPASGTNSPQTSQRYPPPAQSGQPPYQSQTGYPTSYGGGSQPAHITSPPAQQYATHSSSRSREIPPSSRDNVWPSSGHQAQTSDMRSQGNSWTPQPSKAAQAPPPHAQPAWGSQRPSTKPGTPAPAWSAAAPPPQQHMSIRDERGPPSIYGQSASGLSQQHTLHSRYPSTTRAPEPLSSASQPYPRYASTPGPGPPRDPRDPREPPPGRSYTPSVYDGRPPPPGQAQVHGYPAPDPREMQLREARDQRDPRDPRDIRDPRDPRDARDPRDPRDPRDIMNRGGLRPHEYDRHPDSRYGR